MSDYNTDLTPGLSTGTGEAPPPKAPVPSNDELETAVFHTQNSLGSVINRLSRGSFTPQDGYNPVDDIKGWADPEYFRNHGSTFLGSQSPQETQAIKAEIDQGQRERAAIAASGWNGTIVGLRIGLVDPTMFLPMGNAVRLAREATVAGKAAEVGISVGKAALMQSSAQEALLQATQSERTATEGAVNVGSSTLLAALIGGGGYALLAKDGLAQAGIASLDAARVKLSEHNGVAEKPPAPEPGMTGSAGNVADPVRANPETVGSLPRRGVAVANLGADGVLYVGPENGMHFGLSLQYGDAIKQKMNLGEGDAIWKETGFVNPEGRFMDRKEALEWVETNEKKVKPSHGEAELDAQDYYEQVDKKDRSAGTGQAMAAGAGKPISLIDVTEENPVRIQFMANRTGSGGRVQQAIGGDTIIPLNEKTFEQYLVAPRRAEGSLPEKYGSLESYLSQVEKPENLGHRPEFVVLDSDGKLSRVGSKSDIEGYFNDPARAKWRRQVESFDSPEAKAFGALDDEEVYPQDQTSRGTGQAMAAGAAPSDTRNLSPVPYGLDSIPGVRTAVAKMFPNLDVLTNAVQPAKAALSEMVDTPIALMANKEGQTATRFGGPTIERELKQVREGMHYQADQEMLNQWGSYLEQEGGATFVQRQTGRAPAGKISFDDFNAAVYDALSTGDQHPTPQVAAMAQWIRKNGLDPVKDRALASIEGFKETVSRPGETYAPRNWDKEKISANWNDYVSTWTDHLAGEQTRKAQAQERLGVFQGALESHRQTIDKYEQKIAKLEGDADVIAARQEETTRINKAANQRAEKLRTRDQDTLPLKNAQGGAIFETLARSRGNLLADRASAKLSEIESLHQKLAAEAANHDSMREKIEKEIADWDGKSATEAKSALKARAEAEKAREEAKAAGTYKGKDERLSSADKAVDSAVRGILQSERGLERQELKSRAEEIASRIIGTPEGRLPYDASMSGEAIPGQAADLRGHAAHREIDIPYEMAKPWLRRSATEALKSYTHSVLPDAMLAERFDGDPNLTAVMKEIESAYAAKRAEATSEAAQNRLKSQMDSDIKNVAAMRDRIRGTFAYDPTMQGLARFSQNALKINNVISSHGMAVASLPDFAGVAFRHGITSAFNDAWVPFASSLLDNEAWQAVKAAGDEWKAFGIGIETHSASRNHALSDIAEHYRPNSKFERALTWVSDKAFVANLLAPLTDIQKRMATNAVASNILRGAEAVAGGKATAKQIQRLAEGNITEAQAARIWDQWSNNGGERVKGVILPNMDKWTDQAAALAFRGAVGRDVEIAVVQPGYGEIPKFMSKPGFNVLTQYKKFGMSATQRILISNLQRHDAGTMAGLITAVGMGMLAYRINTMASGQKMATDLPTLFKEGISRGGVLGVIDDSNTVVSKFTGGKADIYRAIGADKPLSKYVSRDAASVFLGPTWGKVTNLAQITRAASHPSEWNESDTHALRMMTMGTNFPYLPQMFDKVEQGANHAFGIPMKAKPQ